jgi:S1-C subfamily serine protease
MLYNKRRNSTLMRRLLAILLGFCLVINIGIIAPEQVSAKTVVESGKEESRIGIDCKDFYINQRTVIDVTLQDRTKQEDLVLVPESKGIVEVKNGKWREEQKTFVLIPQQEGTVTLKLILRSSEDGKNQVEEEILLKVHVSDRSEKTPFEIFETCNTSMVEILVFDSMNAYKLGSGFFISGNQIVTNYHVIEEASRLIVRDYDGKVYEVTHLVACNKFYDLAILQVKEESEHALILSSKTVQTGETAYALGSPLELEGTLSEGMVSKAYRSYDDMIYHQSTAHISKSSGGGPLLNSYGEVIGVNCLMILSAQNVYLAIDVNYISLLDRQHPRPISELYEENKDKMIVDTIYITIP